VRVGDRNVAVRTSDVDRKRRRFLDARTVAKVGTDRHAGTQVRVMTCPSGSKPALRGLIFTSSRRMFGAVKLKLMPTPKDQGNPS
jgi:hypothetical protein